jgi:hypothetical protein
LIVFTFFSEPFGHQLVHRSQFIDKRFVVVKIRWKNPFESTPSSVLLQRSIEMLETGRAELTVKAIAIVYAVFAVTYDVFHSKSTEIE